VKNKNKTEVVYLSALESELVEGVQVESNPSRSRAPVQGIQVIESERIQVSVAGESRSKVSVAGESRSNVSVAGESRSKLPVADVPQKLRQSIRD
jgi:LEA14-like dessication related protein